MIIWAQAEEGWAGGAAAVEPCGLLPLALAAQMASHIQFTHTHNILVYDTLNVGMGRCSAWRSCSMSACLVQLPTACCSIWHMAHMAPL